MENEKREFKVGDKVRMKHNGLPVEIVAIRDPENIDISYDLHGIKQISTCKSNDLEKEPQKFKVGDVVWLKSGSPAMTVISVNDERIIVTWFIESHSCSNSYPLESLVKSNPLLDSSIKNTSD